MEGPPRPAPLRRGRLSRHGLDQRAAGRPARRRQCPVRLRYHPALEGRRQRGDRARRRSSHRSLHSARQAVLGAQIARHLLHPHQRHLADGVDGAGGGIAPGARPHHARARWHGALRGIHRPPAARPGVPRHRAPQPRGGRQRDDPRRGLAHQRHSGRQRSQAMDAAVAESLRRGARTAPRSHRDRPRQFIFRLPHRHRRTRPRSA